ncbi:hypothetical protein ACFYXQ_36355 [Nocardia jiangxiensis]|uniref:Uncharacterized protein n=1 Tax=Nocardia jiangxiensis TaxID=282685 RepID=A0ABW6SCB3_9NOCA
MNHYFRRFVVTALIAAHTDACFSGRDFPRGTSVSVRELLSAMAEGVLPVGMFMPV